MGHPTEEELLALDEVGAAMRATMALEPVRLCLTDAAYVVAFDSILEQIEQASLMIVNRALSQEYSRQIAGSARLTEHIVGAALALAAEKEDRDAGQS